MFRFIHSKFAVFLVKYSFIPKIKGLPFIYSDFFINSIIKYMEIAFGNILFAKNVSYSRVFYLCTFICLH